MLRSQSGQAENLQILAILEDLEDSKQYLRRNYLYTRLKTTKGKQAFSTHSRHQELWH